MASTESSGSGSGGGGGTISGAPEFKREMLDVTVPVGSSTKFLVEIRSSSELNVAWFHNDFPVFNSDRYVLLRDRGTFCIQIHKVQPSDEGSWVCRANNQKGGKSSSSAVLSLQIPKGNQAPQFMTGLRGCLWDNGTLSLECDVIGTPIPTLRWYRDGKPLESGSALTIRAFSKESKSYMGLFACEAENCMGSNATFSRVYAKNWADYLKQIGHLRTVNPSVSITSTTLKKTQAPGKSSGKNSAKSKAGDKPGKNSGTTTSGDRQRDFRDENNEKSDDSGIADDTHHI